MRVVGTIAFADKKGRMTTKLVREIQVAARMGGPNPEFNPRLHAAVEVARRQSVYKDTIERAIAKVPVQRVGRTESTTLRRGMADSGERKR